MNRTLIALLLFMLPGRVFGQVFSDAGFMGGSGIGVLPTSSVSPLAQFRVSGARLATPSTGGGFTVLALSYGLSSHLEGYLRLVDDQAGRATSLTTLAFGGKLLLPFEVPIFTKAALWGEGITSDNPENLGVFPENATRFGAVLLPMQNGVRPSLLLGGTIRSEDFSLLAGAGITVSLAHDLQVGGEYVEGYMGKSSRQALLTGVARVLPHCGIQIGGGYLKNDGFSSWIVSFGIVAGSADLDFRPIPEDTKPAFLVPSFDDIEKESKEEKEK